MNAGHTPGRHPRVAAGCAGLCALTAAAAALAANFCAHDASEFQTDLTSAGTNAQDNVIRLVAGTFATAGSTFSLNTTGGHALTIAGGFDGTCANQDLTPGTTVLDGGNAEEVLSIQTNGSITLRHLTIEHGFRQGSSNGGGVGIVLNQLLSTDPIPSVIFANNVVRDNSTDYASGGMTIFAIAPMGSTPVGTAYIVNSLFTGNSAPSIGALFVDLGAGSAAYLTNNTITGNTSTGANTSITSIGDPSGAIAGHVSNTISYGNTADHDFYLYVADSVQFTDNDYGNISGTPTASSSGNLIGIDPKFVGADDFHLQPTSPLLRAGTLTPAGGLPAEDIEGNPRSVAGKVDLGVYEDIDVIFANYFE